MQNSVLDTKSKAVMRHRNDTGPKNNLEQDSVVIDQQSNLREATITVNIVSWLINNLVDEEQQEESIPKLEINLKGPKDTPDQSKWERKPKKKEIIDLPGDIKYHTRMKVWNKSWAVLTGSLNHSDSDLSLSTVCKAFWMSKIGVMIKQAVNRFGKISTRVIIVKRNQRLYNPRIKCSLGTLKRHYNFTSTSHNSRVRFILGRLKTTLKKLILTNSIKNLFSKTHLTDTIKASERIKVPGLDDILLPLVNEDISVHSDYRRAFPSPSVYDEQPHWKCSGYEPSVLDLESINSNRQFCPTKLLSFESETMNYNEKYNYIYPEYEQNQMLNPYYEPIWDNFLIDRINNFGKNSSTDIPQYLNDTVKKVTQNNKSQNIPYFKDLKSYITSPEHFSIPQSYYDYQYINGYQNKSNEMNTRKYFESTKSLDNFTILKNIYMAMYSAPWLWVSDGSIQDPHLLCLEFDKCLNYEYEYRKNKLLSILILESVQEWKSTTLISDSLSRNKVPQEMIPIIENFRDNGAIPNTIENWLWILNWLDEKCLPNNTNDYDIFILELRKKIPRSLEPLVHQWSDDSDLSEHLLIRALQLKNFEKILDEEKNEGLIVPKVNSEVMRLFFLWNIKSIQTKMSQLHIAKRTGWKWSVRQLNQKLPKEYIQNKQKSKYSRGAKRIGVICAYNAQKKLIQDLLSTKIGKISDDVQVSTVDGFQGCEKDYILFTTSRTSHGVGFLRDQRRINVALTRAKLGLFILGNAECLVEDPTWRSVMSYIDNLGWFLNVRKSTCIDTILVADTDPMLSSEMKTHGE